MKHATHQEHHVFIIDATEQSAYILQAAAYSIGRDQSNAIVIDFATISRQHALLLRVPNSNANGYQYRLVDGNAEGKTSANGIFVNGKRVKAHQLKNGDCVAFGEHVKAAYLSLSMGEVELMDYLESISYHSLKLRILDSKETIVSDEMGAIDKEIPSVVSTLERPRQLEAKTPEWVVTLNDSAVASSEMNGDSLDLNRPDSNRLGSSSPKALPIQVWVAIFGGILGTMLIGFSIHVLMQKTKTKSMDYSLNLAFQALIANR